MKRSLKLLTAGLCVLGLTAAAAFGFLRYQNQRTQTILGLTTEQKIQDFDALCTLLDQHYPFWREAEQAGLNRSELYQSAREEIARTDTDIAYFKEIGQFLGEFQGLGHLSVLDGSMYRLYLDTLDSGSSLLSDREQDSIAMIRSVLESPEVQHTYSLLDQSHTGFRSTIGLKAEYQSGAENSVPAAESFGITSEILADGNAAYLKIDSFALTGYEAAQAELENFFVEIRQVPNLIIDLRGNGGGSDRYWEDLLVRPNAARLLHSERWYLLNLTEETRAYLDTLGLTAQEISALPDNLQPAAEGFTHCVCGVTEFEPAPSPYPGKIWVLVDEGVYSASENFAAFCKNTGFATLVGEPTGGDGGIADPMLFALPESGLVVRFSVFYGLNADGSGNEAAGTQPDYTVSEGDDALASCLSLIV